MRATSRGGAGQEEFRPQKQQGSSEEGIWGWEAYDDEFGNAAEKAGLSLACVSRNLYWHTSPTGASLRLAY